MASPSSELRLAAACAMWPPANRRNEAIQAAATGPINWPRFLRVARRHQVIGLVHDGLAQARQQVPPEIAREIAAQASISVRENLAIARESLRIQRLFDDNDLPILFLKGAALAVLAFGDLGLRSSQDIDLLVTREALPAAVACLLQVGYRRFDPPPEISDAQLRVVMPLRKDLGFVHEATGLRIELHWRLFLNPHAMADPSIMATSLVVPLVGTAGLRTMGEEDLFAYLCMHGALHWWNRLKWLADINALLAAGSEGSVEHLIHAAEVRGVGRAAALALLLCRRILKTPLPARVTTAPAKRATMRWLEATALNAMTTGEREREPREKRFGTTRGSLSTFLLSPSRHYRLAELRLHLINQTDVLSVPLPEWLRFLYPLLRLPLWVRRHAAKDRTGDKGLSRNIR
jgi:Uncharacterised nucleotidyltransferase